jgi:2-polyprenyl-3-methyl-5-hydroxy-6-metoxy-1,4-benzoquinol methylase
MLVSSLTYDAPRSELVTFVPRTTRRLLDVGCGAGRYAVGLRDQIPGIEIWGVEPDPLHAAQAVRRVDRLIVGYFPEIISQLPSASFDVVAFNDVLEHVSDPSRMLNEARSLLVGEGRVIASIPNVRHLSVVWPLIRRGSWQYDEFGLLDRTHLRFFTKSSMRDLFEDAGWRVESIVGVNPRWHWRRQVEGRKLRSLRRLAAHRLDEFFYVQYVVTARPPV